MFSKHPLALKAGKGRDGCGHQGSRLVEESYLCSLPLEDWLASEIA